MYMLSLLDKSIFKIFGFLLLTVCPLLFPKIGEQQYSYVQGLCFLSLAWLALTFQMQKRKQAMVVRSMDVAVGVCLSALLLHVFWIKPVNLSIWRWVDAVGLLALYGFARLSSSKEIRLLVACVMAGEFSGCTLCYDCYNGSCRLFPLETQKEETLCGTSDSRIGTFALRTVSSKRSFCQWPAFYLEEYL